MTILYHFRRAAGNRYEDLVAGAATTKTLCSSWIKFIGDQIHFLFQYCLRRHADGKHSASISTSAGRYRQRSHAALRAVRQRRYCRVALSSCDSPPSIGTPFTISALASRSDHRPALAANRKYNIMPVADVEKMNRLGLQRPRTQTRSIAGKYF